MAKVSKKTSGVKTKYGLFKAVFKPETDMGGYVATAPAVQGAVSWGKNLTEAKKMIAECIEGAVEARVISEAIEEGRVRFTAKRIPSFA